MTQSTSEPEWRHGMPGMMEEFETTRAVPFPQPDGSPPRTMRTTFDRFTGRAQQVLAYAQEEAASFEHTYIGTEHLLLGLLRVGDGVAIRTLANLGAEPQRIRAAVERIIERSERPPAGDAGLTPPAKRVIELALDEARLLKQRYVCTEHLLLGLIRENGGIAAKVLHSFGVRWESARAEIVRSLPSAAPGARNNVVMCRLDDRSLAALDTLIEAGIRSTRSEAAAWLVTSGIEAHAALFERVSANVAQIRRLREETQLLAQQVTKERAAPATAPVDQPASPSEQTQTKPEDAPSQ